MIHFSLSGLSLETLEKVGNETRLRPYFLTVRSLTGSGRSAVTSSFGVYIDTTPPDVRMIYHVDPSWSTSEPATFQGDVSSIAVYFEVTDEESEVMSSMLLMLLLLLLLIILI